ncbi:MAG: aminotransferase class IV [Acidobacteria bacterium]|jgi:4-amino-4-deoxychorismate lyase|nr:aminotransferase class IV [Acidobacteriota bacterium]
MHKFVSFNQQIISAKDAFLSAISSTALYGKGIFTTLAIYRSKPFLWEKHWERLTENAKKLGIDFTGFSEKNVKNSLLEIISKNKIINARARITFFDESANNIWAFETNKKTSFLITTADFRPAVKNLRLTVSPFRINSTSLLANVKSCNYLENILALEGAKAKDYDEAVRLNERGEIVSACLANIFWVKNNKIFTPSLETGCLKGTTRDFILENFMVEERKAGLAELNKVEDVFLTSAGFGIRKVANLERANFTNSSKVFLSIQQLFEEVIAV